ncbi:MAG: NADH:flavin oxidoreductase [Desulfobacteraceae bacterium]|nr:NADH:flavin oxidoreductase [Desulfobacteraceae bacterium]
MNSILFKPAIIGTLKIKNRFIRSATMEGMSTPEGMPTPMLDNLYCKLAQGQVGLIVTSGAVIEAYPYFPQGLSFPLAIDTDDKIDAWQDTIDAVHASGAKIAMQLTSLGRQDMPEWRGEPPIAPSAVPVNETGVVPRQMTIKDIEIVVEKFAQCCCRVKKAGFDAVQLHGAHGNLINNFMSPYTNQRTDEYGGSIENRARFTTQIIKRTRELVGPDYPLMLKMNFDDFIEGGLKCDDAVKIAKAIVQAGIDCIEVSGGTYSESKEHISVKGIKKQRDESYFKDYAKALKQEISIPVVLVGGNRTFDVMEQIVGQGIADFVSMSRPFIREPELIQRWQEGNLEKAQCISCNQCFDKWIFNPLRCYAIACDNDAAIG